MYKNQHVRRIGAKTPIKTSSSRGGSKPPQTSVIVGNKGNKNNKSAYRPFGYNNPMHTFRHLKPFGWAPTNLDKVLVNPDSIVVKNGSSALVTAIVLNNIPIGTSNNTRTGNYTLLTSLEMLGSLFVNATMMTLHDIEARILVTYSTNGVSVLPFGVLGTTTMTQAIHATYNPDIVPSQCIVLFDKNFVFSPRGATSVTAPIDHSVHFLRKKVNFSKWGNLLCTLNDATAVPLVGVLSVFYICDDVVNTIPLMDFRLEYSLGFKDWESNTSISESVVESKRRIALLEEQCKKMVSDRLS